MRVSVTHPGKYGGKVSDEPLWGVEPDNPNSIVPLQSKLQSNAGTLCTDRRVSNNYNKNRIVYREL